MSGFKKKYDLGTHNIFSLILYMALPTAIGSLAHSLYSIVDRIYVGNFGGWESLGAIAVITPLNNIFIGVNVLFTVGGASSLSLNLGKGDTKEADRVYTNMVSFALIIAGILAATYTIFAEWLVVLCGAQKGSEIFRLAVVYLRIIAVGNIFCLLNEVFTSSIRVQGQSKTAMLLDLLGGGINVILDTLFVAVLHKGLIGAGTATLISQVVAMITSGLIIKFRYNGLKWDSAKCISIKKMTGIASLGIGQAVFQLLNFINNIVVNNLLRIYGDRAMADGGNIMISTFSVLNTTESFMVNVAFGISTGTCVVIGYNYGCQKYDRVRNSAIYGMIINFIISLAIWLLIMIFAKEIFEIFTGNDVVLEKYGVRNLRIVESLSFTMGIQALCALYYSAIGKSAMSALVTVIRNGIFYMVSLIVMPKLMDLNGVLLAKPVAYIFSNIVILIIFIIEMRRIKRRN